MRAFAPASVTAVFAPSEDGQTTRGASFALADGVTVALEAAGTTDVTLDGEPTDFEPVTGVLTRLADEVSADGRPLPAAVDIRPGVPIGAGFGSSGAATLATALAANAVFDLGLARDRLVELARRAEVAAGTGLGDVYIQDTGGLRYDLGRGRQRVPVDATVEYVSYGGISTEDALGDPDLLQRVREEGSRVLDGLGDPPTLREVLADAWPFARALSLPTDRVVADVEAVQAAGGVATMAMLGETVVATGADGGLVDRANGTHEAGSDWTDAVVTAETRVGNEGARLLD